MHSFIQRLLQLTRLVEFRLFSVGVLLVALVLSAIGVFSERIELAMQERTAALLGADAQVSSSRPMDEEYKTIAQKYGIETAETISFLSMAIGESDSKLAGIRVVTSNYPLKGEVVLRTEEHQPKPPSAPPPGEIYAATALVKQLTLGDGSTLQLGDADFVFSEEILLEPQGRGVMNMAPRIMMNMDDLESTGLLTPASRARFRLLLEGDPANIDEFIQELRPRLKPHESWQIADTRRDEVRTTVGRIVSYIRLASLLTLILSMIAMAVAAQGLWKRQIQSVALLRCLGQKHRSTLVSLSIRYLSLIVPVAIVGVIAGYGLQHLAIGFLSQATGMQLPATGPDPLVFSAAMSVIIAMAILFPILWSTKRIPAMSLLRYGPTDRTQSNRFTLVALCLMILSVTLLLARDLQLAIGVLVSLGLALGLLWVIIRVFIVLAHKMIRPQSSPWYVALKTVNSNGGRSAWLVSAFAMTIFALVLLGIIRTDIFFAWQNGAPDDAPNLFMMNIKAENRDPLNDILKDGGVDETEYFNIIRGRIIGINGAPALPTPGSVSDNETEWQKERRERLRHEFNMTELDEIPQDNQIIQGRWFDDQVSGFSIEEGIAERIGLVLGDRIRVSVAGGEFEAPITSVRTVKWDNMRPNFYLIAAPGVLGNAPRNYLTGVYIENRIGELIRNINQRLPGILAIDLNMILERFRSLVNQGGQAITIVLMFTMLATLLVLVGVLQGQSNARRQEIALFKTMGANQGFVTKAVFSEFALLGLLAGGIGGGLAMLSSWLLANSVFELPLEPNFSWLAYSVFGGIVLVALTGFISTRRLLNVLPVRLFAGSQ